MSDDVRTIFANYHLPCVENWLNYQELLKKLENRQRDEKDTHNNLNVYFDYKTNINSIKLINKYTNI